MQAGNLEYVATDPSSQLRAAIAQNAAAYLDLALPQSISAGRTCRSILRNISIQSVENVGWEIWLFRRKRTAAEVITNVQFQGFWTFSAGSALRIAGAGLYYYYLDGLYVPYEVTDEITIPQPGPSTATVPDNNGERKNLHFALVAREAGKSADDAGAVRVQFGLEPTLGW